jgi:ferredoxin
MTIIDSIYIDIHECSGCGSCVEIAPQVFKINEHLEKAELIDSKYSLHTESIRKAAVMCPAKCIHIETEDG